MNISAPFTGIPDLTGRPDKEARVYRFFEENNGKKPTLTIKISKAEDGVEFIANWDWRIDKLEREFPRLGTMLYANGKIESFEEILVAN